MKYADIVHRCFRCGYCKFTSDYTDFNCPTYRKFRFEPIPRREDVAHQGLAQ